MILKVAEVLGTDPTEVDAVDLERAPCQIIQEALGGVIIHTVDRSALIDALVRMAEICWDWEITMKKLRLVETAVTAAKRRWGSWGVLLRIYESIARDTTGLDKIAESGVGDWVTLTAAVHLLQTQAQGLIDLVAI